jgi:hypothetical protein
VSLWNGLDNPYGEYVVVLTEQEAPLLREAGGAAGEFKVSEIPVSTGSWYTKTDYKAALQGIGK